jgi:hypothetical protein
MIHWVYVLLQHLTFRHSPKNSELKSGLARVKKATELLNRIKKLEK